MTRREMTERLVERLVVDALDGSSDPPGGEPVERWAGRITELCWLIASAVQDRLDSLAATSVDR